MKTKNMFSFSFIISDISFNLTNHYTMTMTSLGTSKVPFFLKLTQEMWLKVMSKEMPCLTDNNEKIVKLRRGSGKDWQGMAVKAKGLKA